MKRLILVVFMMGVFSKPFCADGEQLKYVIFPAPPYMIGAEEGSKSATGIDVDIVNAIAEESRLEVSYTRCTWSRALAMMKDGQADLLSSAFKKPEREEFMLYFDTPFLDRLPIAFYFRKGSGIRVEKYEDIYKLKNVGVLRGASYFERFDKDRKVKKYEVSSQDQLFPMLVKNRFDAIAGYVHTENYRIAAEGFSGKIEKSSYEYSEPANVYMAISKKSPFAGRFDDLNRINTKLFKDGVIERIKRFYYDKYTPK